MQLCIVGADNFRIDPEDTGETQASFSFVGGEGRNGELLVWLVLIRLADI